MLSLSDIIQKAYDFSQKNAFLQLALTRENLRYFTSITGASAAGYLAAGTATYFMSSHGMGELVNAATTVIIKTTTNLAANLLIYHRYNFGHISQYSPLDYSKKLTISNVKGSIAGNSLKFIFHYSLLKLDYIPPLASFLIGYLIPGAFGSWVRMRIDYKRKLFGSSIGQSPPPS